MNIKRLMLRHLVKLAAAVFVLMSYLPPLRSLGMKMYAACLFGEANGLFFHKNYRAAVRAYEKALRYADGMDGERPIGWLIQEAHKSLGGMYDEGLGVEKDPLRVEEHYLKAGRREGAGNER